MTTYFQINVRDQRNNFQNNLFSDMETEAINDLDSSGITADSVRFQWFYDAAYWGQAHELIVPLPHGRFNNIGELRSIFDKEHERIYTFMMENDKVNFFHWRLNAIVDSRLSIVNEQPITNDKSDSAISDHRFVYFGGKDEKYKTAIYDGTKLFPGHVVHGPALIEELTSGIVISPEHYVLVNQTGYDYRLTNDRN